MVDIVEAASREKFCPAITVQKVSGYEEILLRRSATEGKIFIDKDERGLTIYGLALYRRMVYPDTACEPKSTAALLDGLGQVHGFTYQMGSQMGNRLCMSRCASNPTAVSFNYSITMPLISSGAQLAHRDWPANG
jgi:hypothetical protein